MAVGVLALGGCNKSTATGNEAAQPAAQSAQPAVTTMPLQVERLDASLDALVPQNPVLTKVVTGYKWTEGPVWIRDGYLLFAEIPSNSIRKTSPDGPASIFMQPSGYKGSAPYGGPEPGSNGMTVDKQGRLTVAGHAQRDIWRLESLDGQAQQTVLADSYHGKKLNSPNDLVYKSDGSLYFTDPPYGLRTQSDKDPEKELPFNGVYRIPGAASQPAGAAPDRSKLQLLVKDLTRPNGIAFSPDEKYLYVDNTTPKKLWMRYPVKADGTVGAGKVLLDATADTRDGMPDGMKVDEKGNIWSAGPAGVWIISPEGKHIGTLLIPERVGNVAWGGPDFKTLYIMASSSVYRVDLSVAGVRTPDQR
ncbi:SMP-30/gluconolactonase/LRE family protein [Acidipila sp. 4G-K13]|uniref:SMP-30/gluconolactonase/LRE family protein n=2 Tax=Paracidobacterium acidisoli TaxID=2303751 RepID=A0A372IPU4_9BACT|nr:SMP-30/gluconolactonase/LRE family protein [Paracidobacterium acidisoli]